MKRLILVLALAGLLPAAQANPLCDAASKALKTAAGVGSSLGAGYAGASALGYTVVAHSSGALILTGTSGYVAGSMAVLSAITPIGWTAAGVGALAGTAVAGCYFAGAL